jgi:ribose transport system permease protein
MTALSEAPPGRPPLPPARMSRLTPAIWEDLGKRFGVVGVWIVLIVIFGALKPSVFLTLSNFQTMFDSQAVLLVLSLAFVVSLISGDFDLSIAGVFSLDLVIIGVMNMRDHLNPFYAFAVVTGVSLLVGAVQAFLIVRLGLSSFVVTLGTGTAFMGIAYGIDNESLSGVTPAYGNFMTYPLLGFQVSFWLSVLLVAVLWYVYGYTPLGRRLFFVGASRNVARLAGINVGRLRAGSLIVGSLLAAGAAIITAGYLQSADPTVAANFLLPAVSGALLGTTCIWPGRPSPGGTFVATYFLVTGYTGLEELGLNGWVQQVFYGVALVAAVGVSAFAARKSGAQAAEFAPQ